MTPMTKSVSTMRATEKKLRLLETILDEINEGVITTDQSGEILFYNKQLAGFEDLNQAEVLGKKLQDVYNNKEKVHKIFALFV
jgi:PAS domain S-box-containing protein